MGCTSSSPAAKYEDKSQADVQVEDRKPAVQAATAAPAAPPPSPPPPEPVSTAAVVQPSQASSPPEPEQQPAKPPAAIQPAVRNNSNKWEGSAVDKGTQLIETLSGLEGTSVEKVEAFTNLLVQESYVQFASISVLAEDEKMFMVLTAYGTGSDFLPRHFLLSTDTSNWSVQRVVAERAACFWSVGESDVNDLPEDWKCLWKTHKLKSFLAVPIKVGQQLCGVLNVGLQTEVDEQKQWWGLQLRLLAAVMAQHFHDAQLRSKVSWLQAMNRQETIERLSCCTLKGLGTMFSSLKDLHFYVALSLPGRPCAIMFSLSHSAESQTDAVGGALGTSAVPIKPPGVHEEYSSDSTANTVDLHGFITAETLLESALETGQVMKVAHMRRYLRLMKTGSDIAILYKAEALSPASVMVVPLIAPDAARIGGLYVVSRTSTDFGMVRREVVDIVKLLVPTLQQKLYSELNKKLIEVSENCRFESNSLASGAVDDSGVVGLGPDSGVVDSSINRADLVLGTKPEKDNLVADLQEQIRRQLAKVYKGHQDGGLEDLEVYEELGRGGFGTVYRAGWKGQLAAVKVVCDRDVDNGSINGALELALLTSISHPAIIQIHTYFADVPLQQLKFIRSSSSNSAKNNRGLLNRPGEQNCQVMVMDFCDMGSLADVLTTSLLRQPGGKVSMPAILHCLLEVASALCYLHSIGIVHYDLKPENVLLKSSTIDSRGFTCKVADFGLSNIVSDNSYFNKHAEGTITHLAPEAMQPNGKLTRAVDVYAFGIMMWELYSGMRPYIGFRTIDVAVKVSKEKLRPEFPGTTPAAYRALAEQCWQDERRLRPTFRQVMDKLHEMLKDRDIMGMESLMALTGALYPEQVGNAFGGHDSIDFPLHIL